MKQLFLASLLGSTIAMCTAAMAADDLKTLEAAAKAEGAVNSVGMPDDWANWKGTWEDLAKNYGLQTHRHRHELGPGNRQVRRRERQRQRRHRRRRCSLRPDRGQARRGPALQAIHLGSGA